MKEFRLPLKLICTGVCASLCLAMPALADEPLIAANPKLAADLFNEKGYEALVIMTGSTPSRNVSALAAE